jgi:glyoxylase-like metal-dependent hydrolase (beta-lactamase superfamily II)
MQIHALTTGTVLLKRSFLHPSMGARRQLDLFLPGPWEGPVPIHCWAVQHQGRLLLIDTGESAQVSNVPFARFTVSRQDELPGALAAAGLAIEDVSEVVLTHHHGDHVDGLSHVSAPVRMSSEEIAFIGQPFPSLMRRVLRQPLPAGFSPAPLRFEGGRFGAFERSCPLSEDGRIVAVPTPGHTPGHLSVICVDDSGNHVMLAGDVTDTLEQLHARRADAVGPDPAAHVATLERVLEHCAEHPTVFLPSHDPDSAARLAGAVLVAAA